jgi:hypothetical protein
MRLVTAACVAWIALAGSALAQEVVPVANAGPDVALPCVGPDGAAVNLDGMGSCIGTGFTYLWDAPGVALNDPTILNPMGVFPVGVTTVTLTVTFTDPDTAEVTTASDTAVITISDLVPPEVNACADPNLLWPPNHKLHDVHVDLVVFDLCDAAPVTELVAVSSNERDNGHGDGNTSGDIQGADLGTPDQDLALRAERAGPGSGRVYTIEYTSTDGAGNVGDGFAEVIVPHDMGHGGPSVDACDDLGQIRHEIALERKAAKKAAKLQLKTAKKAAKAAKKEFKAALKAAKAAARSR